VDRAAEPDLFGAERVGAALDVLLVGALRAELLAGGDALGRDTRGALAAEDRLGVLDGARAAGERWVDREGARVACDL
jgi:hypothetical protein